MIPQPKIPYLYDEIVNFTKGVDSAKSPDLVAPGYSSFAVNATFRKGKPTNRPAFHQLVIPEQDNKFDFEYGKHQGDFTYHDMVTGNNYLIAARGGWIYKVDLATMTITKLNDGDRNHPTRQHYFCQADKFLIVQDGESIPLIWDNTTMRRARTQDTTANVPINNVSITHIAGIATVTTAEPHGFQVGDFVYLNGEFAPTTTGYIGLYRVGGVPTDTTYTIRVTSTLPSPVLAPDAGVSQPPYEVPIGTFMEFAMGRLCVTLADRKEVRIGDIIRSTPDTLAVDSVLWFTEDTFLAESFRFTLPASLGRIRALTTIPYMGAPTGQGDLLVSGDRGLSTLSLTYPRTQWFSSPIQKVALTGVAIASHNGIIGYNGDVIFRDVEYGVRTFRLADAEFAKSPAQTPISAELDRVFSIDDEDKLQFTAMEVFDNRLLCTVTPIFERRAIRVTNIATIGGLTTVTMAEENLHTVGTEVEFTGTTIPDGIKFPVTEVIDGFKFNIDTSGHAVTNQTTGGFVQSLETGASYYHKGIAVLDYTSMSGAVGTSQLAWDGVWTGLNVQTLNKAFVSGKPRCIMGVYNERMHRNEIWEVMSGPGPDVGEFTTQYPPSWVEFASLDCKKPFSKKKLLGLNIYLSGIRGNIEGSIWYRNDNDVCWYPWKLRDEDESDDVNFEICAEVTTPPGEETNPAWEGLIQQPAQRRTIRLGQPIFECDPQTTEDARLFYFTQLKIAWTGRLTIDRLQIAAPEEIEEMRGGCR